MGLLRFLFSLSVISVHTGQFFGTTLIGGKMAVQAFFIFSGFYISLILDKKYVGENSSYKLFLTNRILRIYPTYLVILILSLLTSYLFLHFGQVSKLDIYIHNSNALNPLTLGYLVFVNLFIVGMDFVMFLGLNVTHGTFFFTNNYLTTHPLLYDFLFIPQAWTLSLEFVFYLLAPFLLKRKLRFLVVLALLSLLLRMYLYKIGLHQEPWTNRFFPTELLFFLAGIFSYRIYKWKMKKKYPIFSLIMFFLLILFTIFYSFLPGDPERGIDIMQLTYFGLLFIGIPFVFQLTKTSRVDRIFGLFSYPMYICHQFVMDVLANLHQKQSELFTIITITTILFLSLLLILFIEGPVNRYRQGRLVVRKTRRKLSLLS